MTEQLLAAGARWSNHLDECRTCRIVIRRGPLDIRRTTGKPATASMCPKGQRLHGIMQGHRARLVTQGGRPVLNPVQGGAA